MPDIASGYGVPRIDFSSLASLGNMLRPTQPTLADLVAISAMYRQPVGALADYGAAYGAPQGIGRGSWYSQYLGAHNWTDPHDRPGSNALGVPDYMQGIALPSRSTLGQWFNVSAPSGQVYRAQQTDVGPARSTGRGIDISAALAERMGYSPNTFPTGGAFTWTPAR